VVGVPRRIEAAAAIEILSAEVWRKNLARSELVILDWQTLVRIPESQLATLDVAAVNLACAEGLPGAERIDASGCLRMLDHWAEGIGRLMPNAIETAFQHHPERWDHSENKFRAVSMILALQKHCGVRYNPTKLDPKVDDPFELDDVFIHGALLGCGGTCASLPVIYAAVGRRLGYPIRLVRTKSHLFNRWDDPRRGESFNLEGSANGVSSYADDHYGARWKYPVSQVAIEDYGYLKSLTPREEVALFIAERAFQWLDAGEYRRAVECCRAAIGLHPDTFSWKESFLLILEKWTQALTLKFPGLRPSIRVQWDNQRHWLILPYELEKRLHAIHSLDAVLNHPEYDWLYWQPMRKGQLPVAPVPKQFIHTPSRI